MSPPIDLLVEHLAKAQTEFLRAADAIAPEAWKTRPRPDRWSAAELVAHVVSVEKAVIEKADRVSQKPPRHIPLYKRFRLPTRLAELRVIRLKSPIPVLPAALRGKEDMLAELRDARERSLAFMEETRHRELGAYLWRHPALGMLNMYSWMEFLAAHENRHTKQMREIADSLPKAIERLQK
jgi:DinB superfamily